MSGRKMSVPEMFIGCTSCDYTGCTTVLRGIRHYSTSIGQIPVEKSLGWCNTCAGLRAIERLPSHATLKDLEQKAQSLTKRISTLEAQAPVATWLRRWLPLPVPREVASLIVQRRDIESSRVKLLHLFKTRMGGSRCLACCSEDHQQLPEGFLKPHEMSELPVALGVSHPGCFGEFVVTERLRINVAIQTVLYDIEGRILNT
jgi:hypothetical protein